VVVYFAPKLDKRRVIFIYRNKQQVCNALLLDRCPGEYTENEGSEIVKWNLAYLEIGGITRRSLPTLWEMRPRNAADILCDYHS
jgi:hypothetical protein